jgi:hypothetical protein
MFEVTCVGCGAQLYTHLICENCSRYIEIGRAVEGMPKFSYLRRTQFGQWIFDQDVRGDGDVVIADTPLEALKGGKG